MNIEYPGMDIATARSVPLKFGDPVSIKARELLGMVSDLGLPAHNGFHVIDVACDECGGSGTCECGGDCCHCRGQGTKRRRTEIGKMQELEIYSLWENREQMDSAAMKLRARARAMRAAREHWKLAHTQSLHDDLATAQERLDFNRIVRSE